MTKIIPAGRGGVSPRFWRAARPIGVTMLGAVALAAWVVPPAVGDALWSITFAVLPLTIVVLGYHTWRRVCPLAYLSSLGGRLTGNRGRRASSWLEANHYYVTFGAFVVALWLRLIALNGNGQATSVFLLAIVAAAALVGAVFTGKTWCNFFCPVSFIEKVYTEPRAAQGTLNSQCARCSGCKRSCPDVNQEAAFWKEIGSRPKKLAYFGFPGLVVAFFVYSNVRQGLWALPERAFHAGQLSSTQLGTGTIKVVPLPSGLGNVLPASSAMLTLILGALVSYAALSTVEAGVSRWARRGDATMDSTRARHHLFAFASSVAIASFYGFLAVPAFQFSVALGVGISLVVAAGSVRMLVRRVKYSPKPTSTRPALIAAGSLPIAASLARSTAVTAPTTIIPLPVDFVYQRQRLVPRGVRSSDCA
jgi:hypothetical protein